MKLVKNSSAINANDLSINFNVSNISEEYINRGNNMLMKWSQMGLTKFIDYFKSQWLTAPFDQWQLCRRPPGLATTAINESFNKQFKETFTKYQKHTLIGMLKNTMPTVCKYYS